MRLSYCCVSDGAGLSHRKSGEGRGKDDRGTHFDRANLLWMIEKCWIGYAKVTEST